MPNEIDDLMDRDPLELTAVDIDSIIASILGDTPEIRYAKMLLRKSTPVGECLNCHLAPSRQGYPKISPTEYVHRFIYDTLRGPIGDWWVLHKCDNPLCINPKHLFLGSHQDNMDDMMAKGRQGKVGGAKPRSFTEEERQRMIELYESGISQRKIAKMFNTSQATVWKYIHHYHLEKFND